MKIQLKEAFISLLFLAAFSMIVNSQAFADTAPASIDFHKTVLPILKDSCFACHAPGSDASNTSKDPILVKKIKKEVSDGLEALTMGDKFPFADDDPAAKQLKHLEKELSKGFMPPEAQAKLKLGLPLSNKNRKILLDWVAQQKKANP